MYSHDRQRNGQFNNFNSLIKTTTTNNNNKQQESIYTLSRARKSTHSNPDLLNLLIESWSNFENWSVYLWGIS